MLSDLADEEEIFTQVEKELRKFEEWAQQVRPFLADPSYTPSYEELRLAVRILGIHVPVYPSKGGYPFRYQIEVRVPQIVKGLVSTTSSLAYVPPVSSTPASNAGACEAIHLASGRPHDGNCETSLSKLGNGRLKDAERSGRGSPPEDTSASLTRVLSDRQWRRECSNTPQGGLPPCLSQW
jgi:hypothetical protein